MTEGLLYKKIQDVKLNIFSFPETDNKLKKVVTDLINMNRKKDVCATLEILDEAKKEFVDNIMNAHLTLGTYTQRTDVWFKKYFGDSE